MALNIGAPGAHAPLGKGGEAQTLHISARGVQPEFHGLHAAQCKITNLLKTSFLHISFHSCLCI